MEGIMAQDLNFMATELRLGLPGTNEGQDISSSTKNYKRASPDSAVDGGSNGVSASKSAEQGAAPATKAQMVGWPPVRSYRKNSFQVKKMDPEPGIYVKVSMDGAPYLRKIDLKVYSCYPELIKTLENMFKLTIGEYYEREGYKGSDYAPAYEDKDGDLMLVGDVPWDMFMSSCKRLRIMRRSEAGSLGSSP